MEEETEFVDLSHTVEHGMITYKSVSDCLLCFCQYLKESNFQRITWSNYHRLSIQRRLEEELCRRNSVSHRKDRNGCKHWNLFGLSLPPILRFFFPLLFVVFC